MSCPTERRHGHIWTVSAKKAVAKYNPVCVLGNVVYTDRGCFASAFLIPASNEPSAVLARVFGECREGHIPRCSAALQT